MSTAPTEAHIDLAVTIYKKRESFPPFDKVKEAAQLIADSEARAVEAANTEIAELKKCIEELYQQAHETVQFSDSNEMSMDMEISAAFGILASHRDEAQATLTAERERVRVLEEAVEWCLSKTNPSPCRCVPFATPPHVCVAHRALANPAANDAKEGSA